MRIFVISSQLSIPWPGDKMSNNLSSHIIWKQETDGKLITNAGAKKPEEPRV